MVLDAALGGAAGVMLAATSFSLIVPALQGRGAGCGATVILIGMLFGGLFIDIIDRLFPDTNLPPQYAL